MGRPDYVIGAHERTKGGSLPTGVVQRLRNKLMRRGFVVLASDTSFSLAALAADDSAYDTINMILDRKREPISLAFPNYLSVQRFVNVTPPVAALLERFTPGPITIVCRPQGNIPEQFFSQTVGSTKRTVGVRISDSLVERELAGCTPYPITTVAVRDLTTREVVQDFDHALRVVQDGIDRLQRPVGWAAIKGDIIYPTHSTVVEVDGGRDPHIIREGEIPYSSILEAADSIPGLTMEDWG